MSTKERRNSVSAPEILRRDSKAFADKKVSLTDIQREREEGSDSSSVDLMRELLSQRPEESPSSSQGSLDWLIWELLRQDEYQESRIARLAWSSPDPN